MASTLEMEKSVAEAEAKTGAGKSALVVALCLAGAAYSGFLLFSDIRAGGAAGVGAPMATVEKRESKVRRKPSTSFIWANVKDDESLYRRDSVQTGDGSAATIRFNDGSLVELGENSLVVIDSLSDLSLNFMRGSMVVRRKTGDSKISVDSNGKTKVEQLQVRMLKPDPLAEVFAPSAAGKTVRFMWQPLAGKLPPGGFAVQVSLDRRFGKATTRTLKQAPGAFEAAVALPSGNYYWRVLGGATPLTEAGRFKIIQAVALQPTWPADGRKVEDWGGKTQFRWATPSQTLPEGDARNRVSHRIEVASDAAFKSIVTTDSVAPASGGALLGGVPDRSLFWRIVSQYGDTAVASRTERFTLEKGKTVAIDLVEPEDKAALEQRPAIALSWSADVGAGADTQFKVELQTADGKAVAAADAHAMSYAWRAVAPGAFRWRVTAQLGQQQVGASKWGAFSVFAGAPIALRTPANGSQIYYWGKPSDIDFRWAADSLASQKGYRYQVEVARDPEFRQPVAVQASTETRLASSAFGPLGARGLPPGKLYWRVRVADALGRVAKASAAANFVYGPYPLLPPPAGATPSSGSIIDLVQQEAPPVAHWAEVKDARGYEVTLYRDSPNGRGPASKKAVLSKTTEKPELAFPALGPGKYSWSVRAIDQVNRRGQAGPPENFDVTYGAPLAAPQVLSPEVQ